MYNDLELLSVRIWHYSV